VKGLKQRSPLVSALLLAAVIMLSACAAPPPDTPDPTRSPGAPELAGASPEPTAVVLTPDPTAEPRPTETAALYPYEDEDGRIRHQLMINGELVETEHLPFSLPGEKGAYYPLEDVLGHFGIRCLVNETSRSATGRVNGVKFTVQARWPKITVGKSTIESIVAPRYVDGCLYVPSFLFMELLDATVDFTADRAAATLVTDAAIDAKSATADGLTLPDHTYGGGGVQLKLSSHEKSACAKLFPADATGKGDEVMAVLLEPNQGVTLKFPAGTYILKLAYGDDWLGEEEAFGASGSYSATEAYAFKKGGRYELETSAAGGDFHSDSQGGFTGN
jgi:hypothetical protein